MQDQIKRLLEDVTFQIGTLRKANELFSDRLAPNFNIFDYLRTDEMGLSRCIASLLNPNGTHGQGRLFLDDFIKRVCNDNWIDVDINNCQVNLEKQANGLRRIDIYLKFQSGEIIGIENKPWADDQKNQLKDYAEFIEKDAHGKQWLLIYLSNNDPSNSEYSIDKELREKLKESKNFVWFDYTELIEWLECCTQKSQALVVRVFIEELAKFIRTEINGELDMAEENVIKNIILASESNLESALLIPVAIKAAKEDLLEKFRNDLKGKLEKYDFELVWDESMSKSWKSYAGFSIRFNKNKYENFNLRFEFGSSGLHDLYWGISRKDKSIKKDTETWNNINSLMSKQFGSGGNTQWWPWWRWVDNNQELGSDFRNWDKNATPWMNINKNQLADRIVRVADSVRMAFENA